MRRVSNLGSIRRTKGKAKSVPRGLGSGQRAGTGKGAASKPRESRKLDSAATALTAEVRRARIKELADEVQVQLAHLERDGSPELLAIMEKLARAERRAHAADLLMRVK